MKGTVTKFFSEKGYGFVKGDDDKDYFVHHTAINEDVVLHVDDRVSFEPAETERGPQAKNVTKLEGDEKKEEDEEDEE